MNPTKLPRLDGARPDGRLRSAGFAPTRRRWPGIVAAGVVGAGIAAAAVSSFYDFGRSHEHAEAAKLAAAVIDDAGITAAVKTALAADPALSALQIEVHTDAGVVRLEGPAPDAGARERAELIAAAPQGVTRVDNRLVVISN